MLHDVQIKHKVGNSMRPSELPNWKYGRDQEIIIVLNLQARGWLTEFRWLTQSHAENQ